MWRCLVVCALATSVWAADPRGTEASRRARDHCTQADELSGEARTSALRESLAEAEAAIAADDGDGLAGKGALLLNLPRLLGGDAAEGERLVRRALAIDPDYLGPRLTLVEA